MSLCLPHYIIFEIIRGNTRFPFEGHVKRIAKIWYYNCSSLHHSREIHSRGNRVLLFYWDWLLSNVCMYMRLDLFGPSLDECNDLFGNDGCEWYMKNLGYHLEVTEKSYTSCDLLLSLDIESKLKTFVADTPSNTDSYTSTILSKLLVDWVGQSHLVNV